MDKHTLVTVVNRTSKKLKGTFNGRPYDIPSGESRYTIEEALFFRNQNPVMGRGTPLEEWTTREESLIGIKELGDDCSPIEQTDAPQRWDTNMVNGYNTWNLVRSRAGFQPEAARQPLSTDIQGGNGFTK